MKVLFSRAPWWHIDHARNRALVGIRLGMRGAVLSQTTAALDRPVPGEFLPYPFMLGYAAAFVASRIDAEVRLRDSLVTRESYDNYFAAVKAARPDVIFFESAPASWDHDAKLVCYIHSLVPSAVIAIVGPAAAMPNVSTAVLGQTPAAACIQGECDEGCLRVIGGDRGVIKARRLRADEVNSVPIPYYDDWMGRRYFDHIPHAYNAICGAPRFPHGQIWSSRGRDRLLTQSSFSQLVSDIKARFQFRSIHLADTACTSSVVHITEVAQTLRHLHLPWSADCLLRDCTPDLYDGMQRDGCFGVRFEIGDCNEQTDWPKVREQIVELKRRGMSAHAAVFQWALNTPRSTCTAVLSRAKSLGFDTVQSFAMPPSAQSACRAEPASQTGSAPKSIAA